MAVLIVICAVLAVGLALVIHGTLVKNRWGINFDSVSCPRCSTVLPQSAIHVGWLDMSELRS
jgi:hypothetical protein